MTALIILHRDLNKAGADEHVAAIKNALPSYVRVEEVNNYEKGPDSKPVAIDLAAQIEAIKNKNPDANFVVVTGDYGADPAPTDASAAGMFKRILGTDNTAVVLSSYTAESKTILGAFDRNEVDYLAVPQFSVDPKLLRGTKAGEILTANRERLIPMTCVPHVLRAADLQKKRHEWDQAVEKNLVSPLVQPKPFQTLAAVVIPGDVEDAEGRPKYFTVPDAVKLAVAIFVQHGTDAVYMVSNGPRTFKYNQEACDMTLSENPAAFNPNKPAFQNTSRMDGTEYNPVSKAFMLALIECGVPKEQIIDGCIAKGKVPPQGFLAFYDALNQYAQQRGDAVLYIDGVSITMMAQAVNVMDKKVSIVACDTLAKNMTHAIGTHMLFRKGYVDQLKLIDTRTRYEKHLEPIWAYNYVPASYSSRAFATPFNDAAIVAERVVALASGEQYYRPDASKGTSAAPTLNP